MCFIKYVPLRGGELKAVILGGDQLACERIQGAQMARLQSPDPTQRLEGLTAKIEDWHSLQAFYQVMKNVHIKTHTNTLSHTHTQSSHEFTSAWKLGIMHTVYSSPSILLTLR